MFVCMMFMFAYNVVKKYFIQQILLNTSIYINTLWIYEDPETKISQKSFKNHFKKFYMKYPLYAEIFERN